MSLYKTKLTSEQALIKIQKYCAYQERSHKEVTEKLYGFGLWKNQVESIIVDLLTDNFLNEERYAEAYASGKFRIKKWGKIKIKLKLKEQRVSDYCIKKALNEIDSEEYAATINILIDKKTIDYSKKYEGWQLKSKLINYLLQKGFEYDEIKAQIEYRSSN